MVDELNEFWDPDVRLCTAESPKFKLVALMYVACDIPAARKCCGFKGHSAKYGCSCCKFFPGGLGYKEFSGFDCVSWPEHDLQESYETLDTYRNAKHKLQGKQCR